MRFDCNAVEVGLVESVCANASAIAGDVGDVVTREVDRLAPLATPAQRDRLIQRSIARLDGLDALDELMHDPDIDEVMVNRGREVFIDRQGSISRLTDLHVGAVDVILERVLAPLGQRLDRTNPIVDARLADGSRICAVVGPVALDGTTMSIRRHRSRRVPLSDFAPPAVVAVLRDLVQRRSNLLITGATSSGKTTLLAALTDLVAADERLVLIEDTSELVLGPERHVVRLGARPPGADGIPPINLAQLVRTALRLRPDRLLIGEFRGAEVLAVVEALNTGHDGSLSTCHANSAIDGLRRVETLVMQAAPTWPLAAIRRQVSRSIDAVIHVSRSSRGARSVVEVIEVLESGDEPLGVTLADWSSQLAVPTRSRA
ncbi:MAG: ATPase, T2SS/T4P/T4SS family [Ilumatobacteraceae bacterium]